MVFCYLLNGSFMDKFRMTGRTTRKVDKCVQDLFSSGWAVVLDHHWNGSDYIKKIFERRMYTEHQRVWDGVKRLGDNIYYHDDFLNKEERRKLDAFYTQYKKRNDHRYGH